MVRQADLSWGDLYAGIGYKMGNELDRMGVKTAADLRQVSQQTLVQQFGERLATFLQLACRGQVSLSYHSTPPHTTAQHVRSSLPGTNPSAGLSTP